MNESAFIMWVGKVIRAELGDTSKLPPSVQGHIFTTYHAFARAYLEWLRIEQGKSQGWIPEEAEFNLALVEGMAHFFSDHQHLVSEINLVKSRVRRLQSLDCRKGPAAYTECVEHIIHGVEKRASFHRVYMELKQENT